MSAEDPEVPGGNDSQSGNAGGGERVPGKTRADDQVPGQSREGTRERRLRERAADRAGSRFDQEDIEVTREVPGDRRARVSEEARRRELRERVSEAAGPEFSSEDIDTRVTNDRIEASIKPAAIERERDESRKELRGRLAKQSESFTEEDVRIVESNGKIRATIAEQARQREAVEDVLAQAGEGFTRDDVTVTKENGKITAELTDEAVRREAVDNALEQAGEEFSREDFTVRETDSGRAVAKLSDRAVKRELREDVAASAGEEVAPGDVAVDLSGPNPEFGLANPEDSTTKKSIRSQEGFSGELDIAPARESGRLLVAADQISSDTLFGEGQAGLDARLRENAPEFGGRDVAVIDIENIEGQTQSERLFVKDADIVRQAGVNVDPEETGFSEFFGQVDVDRVESAEAAAFSTVEGEVADRLETTDRAGSIPIPSGRASLETGEQIARPTPPTEGALRQRVREQVAEQANISEEEVDVQVEDGRVTGRPEIDALREQVAAEAGEDFKPRDVTVQTGGPDNTTRAFISGTAVEREQAEARREAAVEAGQQFGPSDIERVETEAGPALQVGEEAAREVAAERAIEQTAQQVEGVDQSDLSRDDVAFVEADGRTVARVDERAVREASPELDVQVSTSPGIGPRVAGGIAGESAEIPSAAIDPLTERYGLTADEQRDITDKLTQSGGFKTEQQERERIEAMREASEYFGVGDEAEQFVEDNTDSDLAGAVAGGLGDLPGVAAETPLGVFQGAETGIEAATNFPAVASEEGVVRTGVASLQATGSVGNQAISSVQERPVRRGTTLAGEVVAGTAALRGVEKAATGVRNFRRVQQADVTVDLEDVTTKKAVESDELPEFDTDTDAPTQEAVDEIETRAADQPDELQDVTQDDLLFRSESEALPDEVTAERGRFELPGLFASPDVSPLRLRSESPRSLSLDLRLTPKIRGEGDQVTAFPGDDIRAMPDEATGSGFAVRNADGEIVEEGIPPTMKGAGVAEDIADEIGGERVPDPETPGAEFLDEQAEPGAAFVRPPGSRTTELEAIYPPGSQFVSDADLAVRMPSGRVVPGTAFRRSDADVERGEVDTTQSGEVDAENTLRADETPRTRVTPQSERPGTVAPPLGLGASASNPGQTDQGLDDSDEFSSDRRNGSGDREASIPNSRGGTEPLPRTAEGRTVSSERETPRSTGIIDPTETGEISLLDETSSGALGSRPGRGSSPEASDPTVSSPVIESTPGRSISTTGESTPPSSGFSTPPSTLIESPPTSPPTSPPSSPPSSPPASPPTGPPTSPPTGLPPGDPTTGPRPSAPDFESDREPPEERDTDEEPFSVPFVNPILTGFSSLRNL
jgi:hypothetical protein